MKLIIATTAVIAGLAATAAAAEFQTIGSLGMGGAGVARKMGGYAAYWNPAGLAFTDKDKGFSMTVGAGAGLRVTDGLAENVDRLSKFSDAGIIDDLENITIPPSPSLNGPKAVADTVNLLTVVNDFKSEKGALSVTANAAAGFQVRQFGFGLFVLSEGFGKTISDVDPALQTLRNVLPVINGAEATPSQLALLSGPAPVGYSPSIMTTNERDIMAQNLSISVAEANSIVNAVEANLSATGAITPLSPGQAATALTTSLVDAFNNGGTISNNRSAVMIKNVAFAEIPVSYGHAIDLGDSAKLGIGGSLKAVRGRVYQTRVRLIEGDESVTSDDIVDAMQDNYEESTNVTFDLGTQFRYADWLTIGLVGKNLTSPAFKSPVLKDQKSRFVDKNGIIEGQPGFTGRQRDADVKLKPQARLGVAFDPTSWLTIAADLDLTENETVLSTVDYKSRQLGGGIELHPLSWLKIRGGLYKNIANSEIGPVATAGLTIGIPWAVFEVDGSYGMNETQFDGEEFPKEARVQANLTVQF